jgi:hypothetical protein
MIVEHAQPHCASHEYFNGILDDKSKGVFHGRIYVHPIAQKTDAKQTNKNLLLSDDATADTKPQLEIYADDVKCTHGATIGQLNEESIFYLRSRGIGNEETARRMLIHAFAGEIIERIKCEPRARKLTSSCGTGLRRIRICWWTNEFSELNLTPRPAKILIICKLCLNPKLENHVRRLKRPLSAGHSWTTARSRGISMRCRRHLLGAGAQPAVRRQVEAVPHAGRRCDQGHQFRRFGLLHFQGVGVAAHGICVKGKTRAEAEKMFEQVHEMVTTGKVMAMWANWRCSRASTNIRAREMRDPVVARPDGRAQRRGQAGEHGKRTDLIDFTRLRR